ncbi:hypothetical protein EHQ92_09735 [Leptospira biflexa]|jgi:hypothetical protein|uniref:Uncharacterized protein n=1 Tax=Leptospira biflexa serovar Patoc (strain Patoc 1 / ATCC 23582 / Paris) TaxID=456481 RepID=B0SP80_LEPBP|nr:hypothetical protein [Leptospira biflexa]ABZ93762.1 Hypothetical protein LBF_1240 [Leptospira biflexa serovar Patoc strain 'Patoc 1 (Ames)']ABZ97404.1 Conserved hypothetical protein [Leptospira biflexa serovar Patoc strain 'Patoc 1 (Paris)']TGM34090.1 hypothetical protein EHQ89_12850 [Leptospira biflexa]TGM40252.1 hypothetical protein EHQ80_03485 [Leptospira biflexa]TGM48148.1 hypothetical protein EHQ92_09735 [Leptospira biflexa]
MSEDRLFPRSVDEVILEKVRFFFLPDRTAAFVKNLVEGKVSERSLICCNSGCDVCNETIYNCYVAVKKELGIH